MAAQKIKKGDKVVILSGKDKGRHGEGRRASPRRSDYGRQHHPRPRSRAITAGRPGERGADDTCQGR